MARHRQPATGLFRRWLAGSSTPATAPQPPVEPAPVDAPRPAADPATLAADLVADRPAPAASRTDPRATTPIERVHAGRHLADARGPGAEPGLVTMHYPDGRSFVADAVYGGTEVGGTRRAVVAVVPADADVVDGMVIRVDHRVALTVALRGRLAAPFPVPNPTD